MCICMCILHFKNVKYHSAIWYLTSDYISDLDFCMMLSLNSPDYLLLDEVFKDETLSWCHEESKIRLKVCSGWECCNLELNIRNNVSGCTISFSDGNVSRIKSKIDLPRWGVVWNLSLIESERNYLHFTFNIAHITIITMLLANLLSSNRYRTHSETEH